MTGRGRPYIDHRPIVCGILWILRTGAPWRDVPERFENGPRFIADFVNGTAVPINAPQGYVEGKTVKRLAGPVADSVPRFISMRRATESPLLSS